MKPSTLTNQVAITQANLPTNIFLTNYNNMVIMIQQMSNALSYPQNLSVTASGTTLQISSHQRVNCDGSISQIPAGQVTATGAGWVARDTQYVFMTTRPTGRQTILGYWNGSIFTNYVPGNV